MSWFHIVDFHINSRRSEVRQILQDGKFWTSEEWRFLDRSPLFFPWDIFAASEILKIRRWANLAISEVPKCTLHRWKSTFFSTNGCFISGLRGSKMKILVAICRSSFRLNSLSSEPVVCRNPLYTLFPCHVSSAAIYRRRNSSDLLWKSANHPRGCKRGIHFA